MNESFKGLEKMKKGHCKQINKQKRQNEEKRKPKINQK